jgi:N-acyl-D-aspartate/D-glutamate deacylase
VFGIGLLGSEWVGVGMRGRISPGLRGKVNLFDYLEKRGNAYQEAMMINLFRR